jgi:hypothetical protein
LISEALESIPTNVKRDFLNKILNVEKQKIKTPDKKQFYIELKKELFTYLVRNDYKKINSFFITINNKKTLTPFNAKKLNLFLDGVINNLSNDNEIFKKLSSRYLSSYKG